MKIFIHDGEVAYKPETPEETIAITTMIVGMNSEDTRKVIASAKVNGNGHKLWHHKNKPMVCDICGKAYKGKLGLRIHQFKKHGISKDNPIIA